MRILKTGRISPPIERITKCRSCKTKMSYKEDDLHFDFEGDKYVICPLCTNKIAVFMCNRKVKK